MSDFCNIEELSDVEDTETVQDQSDAHDLEPVVSMENSGDRKVEEKPKTSQEENHASETKKKIENEQDEEDKYLHADAEKYLQEKNKGNTLCMSAKDYAGALVHYENALRFVSNSQEEAIIHSNKAACYLATCQHEDAVAETSQAIKLNPNYIKAYYRRATAYEKLKQYDAAITDFTFVTEKDPSCKAGLVAKKRCEKLRAEYLEQQKEEALGKLKELGNMVLGNFGMSVDDFEMKKDEATGSVSIGMKQRGGGKA